MYDISPDDKRFIMLHVGPGSSSGGNAESLILVQNFLDELKRAVP